MQNYLLGTQIAAILSYIGGAFWLYHLYINVFQARLDGANEENKRLQSKIAELEKERTTPGEALQQVQLLKEVNQAQLTHANSQIKRLEEERDAARTAGDEKLRQEKEEMLRTEKDLVARLVGTFDQLKSLTRDYEALKKEYEIVMAEKRSKDSILNALSQERARVKLEMLSKALGPQPDDGPPKLGI